MVDDDEDSPVGSDDLSEYEMYGMTPPRTKRRNRERQQRHKDDTTG